MLGGVGVVSAEVGADVMVVVEAGGEAGVMAVTVVAVGTAAVSSRPGREWGRQISRRWDNDRTVSMSILFS